MPKTSNETNLNITVQNYIDTDPTLKMFMQSEIDPKIFDWHVTLKAATIKIALSKYIHNYNYKQINDKP